jgi:hypothetical protein
MIKKSILPTLFAALLFAGLSSCGNETSGDNSGDSASANDTMPEKNVSLFYAQVPSPGEMFAFMKQVGKAGISSTLLNSTDNEKKYETKKARALNMGVYSADLLYCCTFPAELSNKVAQYFGTTVRMSESLQVTTVINPEDKKRINANVGNADSLVAISNDLYLASFENLDANQRGADLSLMLAGGWIEGLYLMSNMVKNFDADKVLADRIADQKPALDNLVEYMTGHEDNADVKAALDQLRTLKTQFDGLQSTQEDGGLSTNKSGKRVLGGGTKTSMTKEQFESIKTKIAEIRTTFISAE